MGVVDFRIYAPTQTGIGSITNPAGDMADYSELFHTPSSADWVRTPEALAADLDAVGVSHAVLSAAPRVTADEIAPYFKAFPDRFSGVASISPNGGISKAVAEVRRVYDLGFRLIGIVPYRDMIPPSHRSYYGIYAAACELGMGAVVHVSQSFRTGAPLDLGRPIHLDQVAVDFPDLPLVASHGGFPWVNELVSVAWRHRNVYIEMSAFKAVHLTKPGSGWEMLLNYGNGPIQDRLLYGSIWPQFDMSEQLEGVRKLPFKEKVMEKFLGGNATALLHRVGALC